MKFSKIGIVGFKGKSPELIKALEEISVFAAKHRDISFYAVDSLAGVASKGIRIVSVRTLRK